MTGRECGFCTRKFADGEPFVNVRIITVQSCSDGPDLEATREDVFDACKECAARTHIVRGGLIESHDRR